MDEIVDLIKIKKALREAKVKAEAAVLAKTAFIANMSHDLRMPINGIIGISQLIEKEARSKKERQWAQLLNDSSIQLLNLLNAITQNNQENDEHEGLQKISFDVRRLIQDIKELELPTTQYKHLEFHTEIDDLIPQFIRTDRTKLYRILLNLVGNAIKYTHNGYVAISVKHLKTQKNTVTLQFNVKDSGQGIAEEMQSKIFEQFFQVVSTQKTDYQSYGMGLYIAQSYATLLNTEIKLKSKLGQGTTFYFNARFKLGDREEYLSNVSIMELSSPSLNQPIGGLNKPILDTPHVLLIEDNLIARQLAKLMIAQIGCRVTLAEDAESGFEMLQENSYDLVITDVKLPNMSGIDLARTIRKWEHASNRPSLPIIGCTAHSGAQIHQECFDAGINKVFTKPISSSNIQNVLAHFFDLSQSKIHCPLADSLLES